jgi:uncharacterized protein (DUF1778 family)
MYVRGEAGMATMARALKSQRLNFRISDAQEALLRRGANAKGQSMTEFIVASACIIAECELAEERNFKLPPKQWKAFLDALDKPVVANSALHRLLSEPSAIELANR